MGVSEFMKFSDFVVALGILSFFLLNEGVIAKSPRWKRLASLTEFGVIKVFTWRADADIRAELDILILHFKRLSIITGILTFVSLLFKSQALVFWTSSGFLICFFAWFSFRWSFKHSDALQPFAPMVGWSLVGPWAILFLDYLSPAAGLMYAFYPFFQPFGLVPETNFEAALWIFLGFILFFSIYYLLVWVLVTPFAYGVLIALKESSILSKWTLLYVKKSLIYEVAIAVHIFAVCYIYWIGR